MKVEGIAVVLSGGVVNNEATLARWEAREAKRHEKSKADFLEALSTAQRTGAKWDEPFKAALAAFWGQYKHSHISKSSIVTMTTNSLLTSGYFGPAELPAMLTLFKDFLDSHLSVAGGDTWMWQDNARGKGSEVYLNPKYRETPPQDEPEEEIAETETPAELA